MYIYSDEHKKYLDSIYKKKRIIIICRIMIILLSIICWELLAQVHILNTFLFSSPSKIFNTTIQLFKNGELIKHIMITLYEVVLSFSLASIFAFLVAVVLWSNEILAKIIEPYLTILNSLPKIALGPLIIIWVGADINSIIFMALMISLFVTIISIYQGFINVNEHYIIMLKSFGASKWQIFKKVILPINYVNIISALKINISLTLIGVIMGELLVSKKGLGYLIMYGSQVFQIDLVITSVFILGFISSIMYLLINSIENKIIKNG